MSERFVSFSIRYGGARASVTDTSTDAPRIATSTHTKRSRRRAAASAATGDPATIDGDSPLPLPCRCPTGEEGSEPGGVRPKGDAVRTSRRVRTQRRRRTYDDAPTFACHFGSSGPGSCGGQFVAYCQPPSSTFAEKSTSHSPSTHSQPRGGARRSRRSSFFVTRSSDQPPA